MSDFSQSFLFTKGIAVWQCYVDTNHRVGAMNTVIANIAIISITGIPPGG
jgi:hypothetical protein